ncbi:hypothetical protein D3C77_483040 [compost metagenome]
MFAHAGIELEVERRLIEAVEVLQIQVQRPNIQGYRLFLRAVGQVNVIVAQLHVLEQYLPRLCGLGRDFLLTVRFGSSGFGFFFCRRFGRLTGEQFLPIKLAICLQRCPGFEPFTADFADRDNLLGEVDRRFADIQASQARERPTVRCLDGKRRNAYRGVVQ